MILLGNGEVNLCSAPPCMGHEEIALPMLVVASDPQSPHLSRFKHFNNPGFEPNDLMNTLAAGLLSGSQRGSWRVNVERMFTAYAEMACQNTPLIVEALQMLGLRYAFFLEQSPSPLHDGYIARCRLIAPEVLGEYYDGLDIAAETCQPSPAGDTVQDFFSAHGALPDWGAIYGAHVDTPVFRRMFGDEEQHAVGYAVWLESEGVLRAWTRVVYLPK